MKSIKLTPYESNTNDDKRLGSSKHAPFSILLSSLSPASFKISALSQFLNASIVFKFLRIPWNGKKFFDALKSLK